MTKVDWWLKSIDDNRSDSERLRGFDIRLTNGRTLVILESLSRLKISTFVSLLYYFFNFEKNHDIFISCEIVTDRTLAGEADLILFKDHFYSRPSIPRSSNQIWMIYMLGKILSIYISIYISIYSLILYYNDYFRMSSSHSSFKERLKTVTNMVKFCLKAFAL